MIKRYSEMILLPSLEDRFEYLRLDGSVGEETFGWHRYLNQTFYQSKEWKEFRREMIIRDNGCDLALDDFPINHGLVLHHINPVSVDDICNRSSLLLDPDNVVCVSAITHKAIHYSNSSLLPKPFANRQPNDTLLWR